MPSREAQATASGRSRHCAAAQPLPRSFFDRDVVVVARELLGKLLVRDEVVLRIVETEAYRWPGDTACHGRSGRTDRNAAIFGPPGHAYVYLCYGLHNLLNVSTAPDGEAAAVLIRACECVEGLDVVQARRGGKAGAVLLSGPGKVGQALDLDPSWSHHDFCAKGDLMIVDGPAPSELLVGPRVGIDYALPEHRVLPWRFGVAGSSSVTVPRMLQPWQGEGAARGARRSQGRRA